MNQRRNEVAAGVQAVRKRIASACQDAGRAADEVTLIAVTKFFGADDVRAVAAAGIADVGENRAQEAAAKAQDVADLGLRWHFIGQLQSNKAKDVVEFSDVVHSVDRCSLVKALGKAMADREGELECLIQVSLDQAHGRGGVAPGDVLRLAEAVATRPGLRVGGVMAVAPLGADPRPAFERLADVAEKVRAEHPQAVSISAGMSQDLEAAIAFGATHVRVGGAILGKRPKLG